MHIDRRSFLSVASAAAITPVLSTPALAAGPRVFDLYRGKSKIGQQTLSVRRTGSDIQVAVDIQINARLMGLPVYTYTLSSREVWRTGQLMSLSAQTNDNGDPNFVNASRSGGALTVEGSKWSGTLTGPNIATTTYWTTAFLSRGTWLSTQDGTPMNVRAARGGGVQVPVPGGGTIPATRWQVRGDIGVLDLYYDNAGEWVGNAFEARGQQARFVLAQRGADIASLWQG